MSAPNTLASVRGRLVESDNGCLMWPGALDQDGYGLVQVQNKQYRVHRYLYLQLVGPVPEGMQLDHLCRNRACANPDHLEPVTHSENQRRGLRGKLTPEQAKFVCESNETDAVLAHRFGVTSSSIWGMRKRHRERLTREAEAARKVQVDLDRELLERLFAGEPGDDEAAREQIENTLRNALEAHHV